MARSKYVTGGIVASIIWLVVGGLGAFFRNSYEAREANALALVGSREHGIDVQVDLGTHHDQVFVDRIQIQQVLVNLIRNAVDAVLDSSVRSIAIRSHESGKDMVLWGSISLAQALIKANVIDEYQLRIVPVLLGGGRLLFSDSELDLELTKTKAYSSGLLLAHYVPK